MSREGECGSSIWFEVESVGAAHKELTAAGFTFDEAPFDIPPGRLVTLNRPHGNVVGLIGNANGGMPGQTESSPQRHGERDERSARFPSLHTSLCLCSDGHDE